MPHIDNDEKCERGNHRCTTIQEQSLNTRGNHNNPTKICDEGFTLREISQMRNLSLNTVKNRWHKGDRSLADLGRPVLSKSSCGKTRTNRICEGMTLREISEKFNIEYKLLKNRWDEGDRSLADLTRPRGSQSSRATIKQTPRLCDKMTLREISEKFQIEYKLVENRWKEGDRTLEDLIRQRGTPSSRSKLKS